MAKQKDAQQEELQLANFVPYEGEGKKPGRAPYSQAEDDRIIEAVEFAEAHQIPREVAFEKLADDLGRNPKSIGVHWYTALKPKIRAVNEDDEGSDDDVSLLGRLRSIVKERNYFKSKYEMLQVDYEKMQAEHAKLSREMTKIRRLLGDL